MAPSALEDSFTQQVFTEPWWSARWEGWEGDGGGTEGGSGGGGRTPPLPPREERQVNTEMLSQPGKGHGPSSPLRVTKKQKPTNTESIVG